MAANMVGIMRAHSQTASLSKSVRPKCAAPDRRLSRVSATFNASRRSSHGQAAHRVFVQRCYRESNAYPSSSNDEAPSLAASTDERLEASPVRGRSQILAELQSLLEVICRDYHPFCCGGTCNLPNDQAFQLSVGEAITHNTLTSLISELHVVNTTSDNPLASVEDPEMAEMLTSISDYIQYMLGQGQPVALIPTEVHVHTGGSSTVHAVPPKKSAVSGEVLGSVVLALPSQHSETQLEVKWTTGLTHTLDLPETTDESKVQWVAYHGKCTHTVSPVTSGQLITATYNIVRPQTYSADAYSPVCLVDEDEAASATAMYYRGPRAKSIADEVVGSLVGKLMEVKDAAIAPELGVMLSKKYSIQELKPRNLKGGDRLVWEAVSQVWPCKLHSVVEDPEELLKPLAAAASGEEEVEQVVLYEVEVVGEGADGDKLVVSSDGCFSPGVLWGHERVVETGQVDGFVFRPATLIVDLQHQK